MSLQRPVGRVLALLVLLGGLLVAGVGSTTAPASALEAEVQLCADDSTPPCVVSVLRNGAPLDGGWSWFSRYSSYPAYPMTIVSVYALGPQGIDLGFDALQDTWEVTLDVGSIVPRLTTGDARDVTVERDGSLLTVTGRPVTVSGQCVPDGPCPEWSESPDPDENGQWDGTFGFLVSEYPFDEPDLLAASDGLTVFDNIADGSIIPELRPDPETGTDYLWFRMRNRHYYEDGTTVVRGRLEVRIPNQLIRVAFGVPNPELMTDESLDPEVTGRVHGSGTATVAQEDGADAMLVTIDGVTFSSRAAKVRLGKILPTRPTHVTADRSGTSALVEFERATPRGAKVIGHEVRCTPTRGSAAAVTAWGRRAPITVTGLKRGTTYDCRVRGLSKAGQGSWSRPARV